MKNSGWKTIQNWFACQNPLMLVPYSCITIQDCRHLYHCFRIFITTIWLLTYSSVSVLGPFLCSGPLGAPGSCPGTGSRQMSELSAAASHHLEEILMLSVNLHCNTWCQGRVKQRGEGLKEKKRGDRCVFVTVTLADDPGHLLCSMWCIEIVF